MTYIKYYLISMVLLLLSATNYAQTTWHYESEIKNFEKLDKLNPPKKAQILFVGSSSFRLWTDMESRFHDYNIIKRGFGGGTLADVNHFAGRIIYPYHPSKIFLYAGANDISGGKTAEEAYQQFVYFYQSISKNLPKAKVYFISAKYSPRRKTDNVKYEQFNTKVKAYISKQTCNWTYIDASTPLLESDGSPKESLFIEDKLHLNSTGYDIWEKIIRNYL